MIKGVVVDTLELLLAQDGFERGRLNEAELAANCMSRLSYTDQERRVLRQSEAKAEPAKKLCKLLHDNNNTYAYIIFQYKYRVTLQDTAAPTIPVFKIDSRTSPKWTVQRTSIAEVIRPFS